MHEEGEAIKAQLDNAERGEQQRVQTLEANQAIEHAQDNASIVQEAQPDPTQRPAIEQVAVQDGERLIRYKDYVATEEDFRKGKVCPHLSSLGEKALGAIIGRFEVQPESKEYQEVKSAIESQRKLQLEQTPHQATMESAAIAKTVQETTKIAAENYQQTKTSLANESQKSIVVAQDHVVASEVQNQIEREVQQQVIEANASTPEIHTDKTIAEQKTEVDVSVQSQVAARVEVPKANSIKEALDEVTVAVNEPTADEIDNAPAPVFVAKHVDSNSVYEVLSTDNSLVVAPENIVAVTNENHTDAQPRAAEPAASNDEPVFSTAQSNEPESIGVTAYTELDPDKPVVVEATDAIDYVNNEITTELAADEGMTEVSAETVSLLPEAEATAQIKAKPATTEVIVQNLVLAFEVRDQAMQSPEQIEEFNEQIDDMLDRITDVVYEADRAAFVDVEAVQQVDEVLEEVYTLLNVEVKPAERLKLAYHLVQDSQALAELIEFVQKDRGTHESLRQLVTSIPADLQYLIEPLHVLVGRTGLSGALA